MSAPALRPPEPLGDGHELDAFDCGEPELNDWLMRRARANEQAGASRTYVVCEGMRVVAYYSLAVGAVQRVAAPGKVRRNMPEPIPVVVLGRLAVHKNWQGRGLGRALLRDAVVRTLGVADIVGIRAILVHAISESARDFYAANGFTPSPIEPMTLMVTIQDIRAAFE